MAFENVKIKTTLNGLNLITGPRADAVSNDVVVASLTNNVGVSSYRWQLKGRPEFSSAGGGGNAPWALGVGATATFVVDADAGGVRKDGTFVIECVVNEGTPTETHITSFVARPTTMTILAPGPLAVPLRKLGVFEALEDIISIANVVQGWATQLNRWLCAVQEFFPQRREYAIVAGDQSTDQTGFVTIGATYVDPAEFSTTAVFSLQTLINTSVGFLMDVKLHDLTNAVDLFTLPNLSGVAPTLFTYVFAKPVVPTVYTILIRLTAAPGPSDRAYCKMARLQAVW